MRHERRLVGEQGRRQLSSDGHAGNGPQGLLEARGIHVVENLPREDGALTGLVEDRFGPGPGKAIGFVRRDRIGIRIAVSRERPHRSLSLAWCA
jgi:hypothetical protein